MNMNISHLHTNRSDSVSVEEEIHFVNELIIFSLVKCQ